MNEAHLEYLASPDWARQLETELLPWIERVAQLGDDVLEVGPGPGLTTDLLRRRAQRITAVELDEPLARDLTARLAGTNVEVIHGDAATIGLPSDRFSGATCFSMLHHVPSAASQDQIFAEIHRALRPGAGLFATDSRDLDLIRAFHENDTFVPLGDDSIRPRLQRAGFVDVEIDLTEFEVRFSATKPVAGPQERARTRGGAAPTP